MQNAIKQRIIQNSPIVLFAKRLSCFLSVSLLLFFVLVSFMNSAQAQIEKSKYYVFLESPPSENYKEQLPSYASNAFVAKVMLTKPVVEKVYDRGNRDKTKVYLTGSFEFVEVIRGTQPFEMEDYFDKEKSTKNIYNFKFLTKMESKSIEIPAYTPNGSFYYVVMYKASRFESRWIYNLRDKYRLSDSVLQRIRAAKLFEKIELSETESIEKKDYFTFLPIK